MKECFDDVLLVEVSFDFFDVFVLVYVVQCFFEFVVYFQVGGVVEVLQSLVQFGCVVGVFQIFDFCCQMVYCCVELFFVEVVEIGIVVVMGFSVDGK